MMLTVTDTVFFHGKSPFFLWKMSAMNKSSDMLKLKKMLSWNHDTFQKENLKRFNFSLNPDGITIRCRFPFLFYVSSEPTPFHKQIWTSECTHQTVLVSVVSYYRCGTPDT